MSDCIIFAGKKLKLGYGYIWRNGKTRYAHRDAWESVNGPIPAGFVIDHVCHNEAVSQGDCVDASKCQHRACINVEHLRMVSQSENIRAGLHSIEARKTCPQGHSYNDARNILQRKDGSRECAECNRVRAKRVYLSKKLVTQ